VDLWNPNPSSFFKLSKQGIWILITEIQIHVPKSCDPNTAIESGFCLQEYPLFICNSISLTVQKKRGVIYARKKHCKNVIIFPWIFTLKKKFFLHLYICFFLFQLSSWTFFFFWEKIIWVFLFIFIAPFFWFIYMYRLCILDQLSFSSWTLSHPQRVLWFTIYGLIPLY